ncbi:MAG TPA: cytochrome c [Casimicrobiaceae bacterium]|nr:cytochrome c [Casimicrobiaceae bacterium]
MKAKLRLLAIPLMAGFMGVSAPALSQTTAPMSSGWNDGRYMQAQVPGANQNLRNLYRLRCATCHGENGEGSMRDYPRLAPALKGNPFIQNAPPDAIIRVIRLGREGPQRLYHESFPNMPAFGAEAVPDADALVTFLKGDLQR